MFFDETSLKSFIKVLEGVGLTCSLSFYQIMEHLNRLDNLQDYRVDYTNTSSQGFTMLFTNVYDSSSFTVEVAYAPR